MKKITQYLVRNLISDYRDIGDVTVRSHYGALEAWVSIGVNILLFLLKGLLGVMIGSVAVIADAFHTLSDTGTSIIILIGFKIAKKPGDQEHPFGHGRAEHISALIVSIALIVTGIEVAKSAAERIIHPTIQSVEISWLIIGVLMVTVVIKEIIARFARELGIMIRSKTLEADFWHHRSDALSTVLVVASLIGGRWGLSYFDGLAGVLVALVIIYSGYKIARDAINPLLGERPSEELLGEIKLAAKTVAGVEGVHDVIVHHYGQLNMVSLHIEVLDDRPILALHDISEKVEAAVEKKLHCNAVVHIDPFNRNHQRYKEIRAVIGRMTGGDRRITSFHDLRILNEGSQVVALFDITLSEGLSMESANAITEQLSRHISGELPDVKVVIKAEPGFAYSR
ncbi:MAG: cation diffusion facilitator family transporter [Phycisphaerae bacterium]|nr:cation diffusion facilitator family transporter [Phycisphaerae bacterium]